MFTLEQINAVHDNLGSSDTLLEYLQALRAIGVDRCDSFVTDGHTEYLDEHGAKVATPPAHDVLVIVDNSDQAKMLEHLELHKQGLESYLQMSKGLADSGVEKWTFDTGNMTMTYSDLAGNAMLVESIE